MTIAEVCRAHNEAGIPMIEPDKVFDACSAPACPSCGFSGTLRWVPAGCFVECIAPDCLSTFAPTAETIIKATVEAYS